MIKQKQLDHLCYGIQKNCYATLWSYGEICVGCGCCHKDIKIRRKARLVYWKDWLNHNLNFNSWGNTKDIIELQKRNIKIGIQKAKQMIKYYSKKYKKLASAK